jgi:hypothetical protein
MKMREDNNMSDDGKFEAEEDDLNLDALDDLEDD